MADDRRQSRRRVLELEAVEDRTLMTLVFLFSGNALGAAGPGALTQDAARILQAHGDQTIQLATPAMNSRAAFEGLARSVRRLSHGAPIGLVGFSAGGLEALRLAGEPSLHVIDVLDYYGPPDLNDYFAFHGSDSYAQGVRAHVRLTRPVLNLLSGPSDTQAHVVAAFGLLDHNIVDSVSRASLAKDFPTGTAYDYLGGHGVPVTMSPAALEDFLAHL